MKAMKQQTLKTCVVKANARSEAGETTTIGNTQALVFMHPAGSKAEEHGHDETHIIVIRSGQMQFRLAGEIHKVGPGDIVFIPPGVKHSFETLSPQGADVMCLCIPNSDKQQQEKPK